MLRPSEPFRCLGKVQPPMWEVHKRPCILGKQFRTNNHLLPLIFIVTQHPSDLLTVFTTTAHITRQAILLSATIVTFFQSY